MATRILSASIFSTQKCISSLFFRSYSSLSIKSPSSLLSLSSRFRCIAALPLNFNRISPAASSIRCFSTRQTTTSLNDSNPNWSNRPPKETILLDGCDFEHWLIVMEKPEGEPTRDEIIDSYIKTLATIVGSEEEARMKIYSVSTRHYYAFGALISEELSYKMKELEKVRWVLPDSYLDVKNKDYGGEPFINGQAVPYDPKYHEEWVRNNARANERNRRNDRPRNFDRSRNFERRRENTQNNMGGGQPGMGGPQNMGGPPAPGAPPNMGGGQPAGMGGGPGARPIMGGGQQAGMGGGPGSPPNMGGGQAGMGGGPGSPPNMGGGQAGMGGPQQYMGGSSPNIGGGQAGMGGPQQYMGGAPPNMGQMPQNNMGGGQPGMGGPQNMGRMPQNINMGGMPQNNNMGGMPQNSNMGGMPQNSNLGGMPHNNNMGGMPHNNNMGGMPQNNRGSAPNMGGVPPNMGGVPPNMGAGNFQPRNVPNNEGFPLQSGPGPNSQYQNYPPNMPAGGNPHQTQDMPGRDMPPPNYHQ